MKKSNALLKFIFTLGLLLIFIGVFKMKENDIVAFINKLLPYDTNVVLGEKNEYYRDYNFLYVQNTENFSPNSFQDILNIYYTVINAGKTTFTFYCPKEYDHCLSDIQKLANDQDLLSDINNYVHPYNGFSHIETEYDTLGRVTINIIKSYREEDINMINGRIEALYLELTNESNTPEDNIRNIHDYIVNHAKYDSDRSDRNITTYKSDIVYGPLFEGYAICGGYTDLMELFLEKMNIKSFKVSSDNHVWNAINLGTRWYHLDLTWDDPVSSDGGDYLEHNYFMINTSRLLDLEKTQHNFNQERYPELREANS